jgi:four helix bundle protein
METGSVRELLVWQKATKLVTEIYFLTRDFPDEELYLLTARIRRAIASVAENITEGYEQETPSDYIHFLRLSLKSLREFQDKLKIAANDKYCTPNAFAFFMAQSQEISYLLFKLMYKIETESHPPKQ